MDYTRKDLQALQAQTLDDKIDHTIEMLENFYLMTGGKVYLSYSGGKDSTVLKHIIEVEAPRRGDKLLHNIPLVFGDTGLEYPEVREFAKQQGAIFIKPRKNFRQVLVHYGYPIISKSIANVIVNARRTPGGDRWIKLHGLKKSPDGSRSPFNCEKWLPLLDLPVKISDECCAALKKRPMISYEKKSGLNPITATTAAESFLRTSSWVGRGCNTYSNGKGKSNPMSAWLEQDVLHYIKRENIAISSAYGEIVWSDPDGNDTYTTMDFDSPLHCTGCPQTGCIFCAFGQHLAKKQTSFQMLKKTHPNLYEYMMDGGSFQIEDGKEWWMPDAKGLGFARVFDMVNSVYGKDFYRYE